MCSAKGSTYFPVTFKTLSGRPVVISNLGLPRETPVPQSHSDSSDDIVHYGLARKHKNKQIRAIKLIVL